MKLLKRILIGLVVILVLACVAAYGFLHQKKPTYSGKIQLQGLQEQVEVYFDKYGIPHIYAENEVDAQYALGYVHAQDRLFQMEMIRRAGRGELAEVLGPDLLETDRFFRTIGIMEDAKKASKAFHALSEDDPVKQATLAYHKGINAYLEKGERPLEFQIMGIPNRPFDIEDTYAIYGYMAFSFAQAFRTDPLITRIYEQYGPEYLADLDVHWHPEAVKIPQWGRNPLKSADAGDQLSIRKLFDILPTAPWIGSNSWVLGPEKTKSGKVLFSNDTHIGFAQPSIWYEAHIECPGLSKYGNYLAGVPFAPTGHNRYMTIGLTMLENDDIDFYIEKLNPDNKNQVWFKDHWEDMAVRDEVIRVKDDNDFIFKVKTTRHGPIVNEAIAEVGRTTDQPVSMWWVHNKFTSQMLQASYKMGTAKSMEEVRDAVSLGHAPGLNVMYGDADGNIAWWAMAKLPIRPDHVDSKLFLDGSSGEDEILGFTEFAHNPQSENPPSGYLYSANNQPDTVHGMLHPGYYIPRDRAERIVELLDSDKKWDLNGMKEMLNDVHSPVMQSTAQEIARIMENEVGNDELANVMLDWLKNWDGDNQLSDTEPTFYTKLCYHIHQMAFEDELGESDFQDFLHTHLVKRSFPYLVQNDSARWWDNVSTEDVQESRTMIVAAAFEKSIKELVVQLGENPEEWKWEKVHFVHHPHPFDAVPGLDDYFNVGPFPIKGNIEVLNNQMFPLNGEGIYYATGGPAKRRLIDFADIEHSWSVLPTGQSGRLMSPHYDDQAMMYVNGEFRHQMLNKEEIQSKENRKLTMLP